MLNQEERDRKIHVILVAGMITIMLGAVGVAAITIHNGRNLDGKTLPVDIEISEGAGEAKELPEFMIENIKPDELEQLKP